MCLQVSGGVWRCLGVCLGIWRCLGVFEGVYVTVSLRNQSFRVMTDMFRHYAK